MAERTLDVFEYIRLSNTSPVARAMKIMGGLAQRDGSRKQERPRRRYDAVYMERVDAIIHGKTGNRPWYGDGSSGDVQRAAVSNRNQTSDETKAERVRIEDEESERRTLALIEASNKRREEREQWPVQGGRKIRPKVKCGCRTDGNGNVLRACGLHAERLARAGKLRLNNKENRMGFGAEVDGEQWQDARRMMAVFRFHKHSWTDISNACGMKNRGWARSAYDSKHVLTAGDFRTLERTYTKTFTPEQIEQAMRVIRVSGMLQIENIGRGLLKSVDQAIDELQKEIENGGSDAQLSPKYHRMKAIIDELVAPPFSRTFKWVAESVFGYSQATSLHEIVRRKGAPSDEKMARAEAMLLRIRNETYDMLAKAHQTTDEQMREPDKLGSTELVESGDAPAVFEPPPPIEAPAPVVETRVSVPVKEPESVGAFDWTRDVQDGLMQIVEQIERKKATAPKILRPSYDEAIKKIMTLAEEFE